MKYAIVLILLPLFLISCKEEDEPFVPTCGIEAQVIGYDLTRCACCGGYLLEVDTLIYRVGNAPDNFLEDLDNVSDFPVDVWVSLDTSKAYCLDMRIDLECGEVK